MKTETCVNYPNVQPSKASTENADTRTDIVRWSGVSSSAHRPMKV